MPRRSTLVCQYLENVASGALEQYAEIIRGYIRHRHGIYALYRKGRLYYVGLATNLRGRLWQHVRDRHRGLWDRFSVYLTIGDTHMKELESLLLRIGKPAGNKQSGKFPRAENLKRRLKHDILEHLRASARTALGEDVGELTKPRRKVYKGILGQYFQGRRVKLRRRYKGKWFFAYARRDGRIRFQGRLFRSPSDAGTVARGGKHTNGWRFWFYERAPNDWVVLDELRR